ncbi:hypothetical protein YSY43_44150 [Paenibacillus sp. YSY-4.3]
MNQNEATIILHEIIGLYDKHLRHFDVSSYLEEAEEIDSLYQKLLGINTNNFNDLEKWKMQCEQVYKMHNTIKTLVSQKMAEMRRARKLNYGNQVNPEGFYIDRKG